MEALRCDLRWKVACGLPIDHRRVPPDDVDGVAQPAARLGPAAADLRRGPGGDRPDRGAEGQDPAGVGFGGPRRRGGHPGHRHPADRRGAAGPPGGARRRRRDRASAATPTTGTTRASRAIAWDDTGRPRRAGLGAGQRRHHRSWTAFARRRAGRAGRAGVGAAGVGGRAGRRTGRGLRRHRRAVAHRPHGSPRTGSSPPSTRRPGTCTRPSTTARTATRRMSRSSRTPACSPPARLTKAGGEDNHEAVVGLACSTTTRTAGDRVRGARRLGLRHRRRPRRARRKPGTPRSSNPAPLRPAVAGGFTLDDFTVDETAGTVTCPNGITRRITATRSVTFGAACRGCPLRQRCTTAKDGRTLQPAPTRRAAARRPPRLGHRRRPARHLPPAPAHGRTLHRLAHRPERPLPPTALPRRGRQRLVATHPHGRPQPAPPAQPRPHPHRAAWTLAPAG